MDDEPGRCSETDIERFTASGDGGPPSRDILSVDPVYEALGHPRRRYLCYTLLEDTEWSLADLATKVAAWENDVPEHAVPEHQWKRVYVSLYHVHVPKLVDEGVVHFEELTEMITAAGNAERVLAALRGMDQQLGSIQETHARGDIDDERE